MGCFQAKEMVDAVRLPGRLWAIPGWRKLPTEGKIPWGTSKPGGGGHLRRHCQCLGKGRRFVGSPKKLKSEQPLSGSVQLFQKIVMPNVASRTSLSHMTVSFPMRNSEVCERMMSWCNDSQVQWEARRQPRKTSRVTPGDGSGSMNLQDVKVSTYPIPQPAPLWGAAGLGSEHWKVERHYGRFVSWSDIQGGNKTKFRYHCKVENYANMRLFLCKAQW